ncbi:MAG: hypothetical protein ACM34G_11900, partial [Acidobacteriota bacterium]
VSLCLCGGFLMALMVLAACQREQPPRPDDPYRNVPAQDRESLRAAVQQFAGFQVAQNWEKMYEVLEEPKEEKGRFLRRRAQATASLLQFYPTYAEWIPEFWTVTGCGVFQLERGEPEKTLVASTRVKRKDDGWTLTPIGIEVFPDEPGHVKGCKAPR